MLLYKMKGLLTRKQLWLKCNIKKNNHNNLYNNKSINIPSNSILKNNNTIKKNNINKNVTFNEDKYITLIPIYEELDKLFYY